MGTQKAGLPAWKTFSMALLAGAYVGFGGLLALSVGASCPELAAANPGDSLGQIQALRGMLLAWSTVFSCQPCQVSV